MARPTRAEINGAEAEAADLRLLATVNYGHFTSMQVRQRGVRGFGLHLDRLDRASWELFGRGLDRDLVRGYVRHALGDDIEDASLRVTVFTRDLGEVRGVSLRAPQSQANPDSLDAVTSPELSVLVTVADPAPGAVAPLRVRTVDFERDLPHVKHVGTFGMIHHGRQARLAGFDDALFIDRHGRVSEGSVWNVCFYDGDQVIWPSAPALAGVSMQLLRAGLDRKGIGWAVRSVRIGDLPTFTSAFFSNSNVPVRPVATVDDIRFTVDPEVTALLTHCVESNPSEPI